MSKRGVDLSKWNVINDYSAMKNDGVEFAILKAINSSKAKDGRFETHIKGCSGANIPVLGTYHYSYATNVVKAKEAAKNWLEAVNGRFDRFYLDWEDASLPKTSLAVDIINAYADIINSAGYDMDLYVGMSYYNSYLKKYAIKIPYDIWMARYYAGYSAFDLSDAPNEKYKPTAERLIGWQYSSSGVVKGAAGRLDLNVWYENTSKNTVTITVESNPFTEPIQNVKLGTTGNDANWVLWYLWRFGKITDVVMINGIITKEIVILIKEVQSLLGLVPDGIVGKQTRAVWKKIC